uniref:THAP-type domain-containing protein n=2 Tax=Lutzomyia longipalpis TaxID=7200 RepID=A0A1B0GII1_LUTLO
MVSRCSVRSCTSQLGTPDIKFYRIPVILTVSGRLEKLSTQRRKAWIEALGRPDLTDDQLKSAKVCSRHFISGKCVSLTEVNSPDWVPNMNLGAKTSGTRMIFKQEHVDDGSSADEQRFIINSRGSLVHIERGPAKASRHDLYDEILWAYCDVCNKTVASSSVLGLRIHRGICEPNVKDEDTKKSLVPKSEVQVISDVAFDEDVMDDQGDKHHMIADEIVEDDDVGHQEIILEPSSQAVVVTSRPQIIPATTTIKKITVTPVSGAAFSGRNQFKVATPVSKTSSPIFVTQKMLQTPRTVTVVPKGDFRFTQGQTTIKRKLDVATSPVVVKLPMDVKRFKTIPARTLGNIVVQQQQQHQQQHVKDPMAGVPKIVRLVRNKMDRGTQTDVTGELLEQFQVIHDENQVKIAQLEEQVRKCKYTPEMFENDDKRTEYFTGLDSYITMITLYNTCEAELPQSTALTKFEIFILTLLKLRLKLPLTFLAYQFCISPKAASFYFNECLNVLHKSLRELFAEPSDGQEGIEIISEEN